MSVFETRAPAGHHSDDELQSKESQFTEKSKINAHMSFQKCCCKMTTLTRIEIGRAERNARAIEISATLFVFRKHIAIQIYYLGRKMLFLEVLPSPHVRIMYCFCRQGAVALKFLTLYVI